MRWLFTVMLLAVSSASFATTIGHEADVATPTSAQFLQFVGRAPADGSVEPLNPPMSMFLYRGDDPYHMGYPDQTVMTFRYQITTNGWVSPLVDIITSNNFPSCFDAFTNADGTPYPGTFSNRIIYMNSNGSSIIATSTVQTFTIAPGATIWNRKKYLDPAYITTNAVHPHMMFNTNNRAAMAAYMHGISFANGSYNWLKITNDAVVNAVNQTWWNSDSITNQGFANIMRYIAQAALASQLDSNAFWQGVHVSSNVNAAASLFIAQNLDRIDPNSITEAQKYLALAYDWTASDMTPAQQSNCVRAIKLNIDWLIGSDWWYVGSASDTNRVYNHEAIQYYSAAKYTEDHQQVDNGTLIFMCSAILAESPGAQDAYNYALNYTISKFEPSGMDQGRGYAEQSFRDIHAFSGLILLACQDPQFTKIARLHTYPHFNCYLEPLNYVEDTSARGDFGMRPNSSSHLPDTQIYQDKYQSVALMIRDGSILRQHNRNVTIESGSQDPDYLLGDGFIPFYFPTNGLAETPWPKTYYMNPTDGYAISGSDEPSSFNLVTNGVQFTLTARPSSVRSGHSTWSGADIEWTAYGTHSKAGWAQYFKSANFQGMCLLVDGIGTVTPYGQNPYTNIYGQILQFTNTSDYTYAAVEVGNSYNKVCNTLAGGGLGQDTIENYAFPTNARPYVVSVQRRVLFPHKKYLVVYDMFTTTTNATFQWKMPVLEPTLVADTNAMSFHFTSTNYFNGSNVTTYVQHIVNPSLIEMDSYVGTNYSATNFITGENFANLPNVGIDRPEPQPAAVVWCYNKTKTMTWHHMTVVYPVQWGHAAPTITRIDDNTATILEEGTLDQVAFDPTTGAPTFALGATPSVSSSVKLIRAAAVKAGAMKLP